MRFAPTLTIEPSTPWGRLLADQPLADWDGVAGEFDALADSRAVAAGPGDRWSAHEPWLVAVEPQPATLKA